MMVYIETLAIPTTRQLNAGWANCVQFYTVQIKIWMRA